MRLFAGLFAILAGQALLTALLMGSVLAWGLHRADSADRAVLTSRSLNAYTALAAARIGAGDTPATAARAAETVLADNDPGSPVARRVALYSPAGARLGGVAPDGSGIHAERPVRVGGTTVAIARVVRSGGAGTDAGMGRHLMTILGASVAVFLILLLAAYGIARRWTEPQRILFDASRAIAQGDYETDVSESGPFETRATMRNLGRIARSFDRLETARRTWLVSVSEDLRRSVHTLTTRLARLRLDTPPDRSGTLEEAADSVRQLGEMAEDLRAVALADLGRLPVRFASVDPRALIHNAIWASGKRAEAQQVSLEAGDLPTTTVPVQWDGQRIEQLFLALIENSLRYTPAGGRIVLGLQGQRGAWRLIVDDTAPGIDIGLARELFEPFYRSKVEPGESVMNSGLGLATAQAIVEAHHGRIEASASPIGGLRVTVTLPGAPPIA